MIIYQIFYFGYWPQSSPWGLTLRVLVVHYSNTCSVRCTASAYAQMTNARNWPQDVEGQIQHNVCFQLRAWFSSVKSVTPNSASMLWAQASREEGGFTELRSWVSAGLILFSDLLFASQIRHSSKCCPAAVHRRTLQYIFQQVMSFECFQSIMGSGFHSTMD